jgi:hypothetical protein
MSAMLLIVGPSNAATSRVAVMPWGNRSILFRDPDGNRVNLFAPLTEHAIDRFNGRA